MNSSKKKTSLQSIRFCSSKGIAQWRGSISIFDSLVNTRPVKERENLPWGGIMTEVCPPKIQVSENKTDGKYYIACLLKAAPLIGKTLEAAQKSGNQVTGKMRSRDHVTESSLLTLEFDGISEIAFKTSLEKLEENKITFKAWTTFSYGDPDKSGMFARMVIPIDRPLGVEEYALAFYGMNEYFFDGKADPSGAKLYQPQGVRCCHPSRVEQTETWENFRDLLSADALIQIGKPLLQPKKIHLVQSNPIEPGDEKFAKLKKLLKSIDSDVGYHDWLKILLAIFNETGGSDEGLELADTWSSAGNKYRGPAEITSKWKSFDPNRESRITMATLYKMAKDSGVDLCTIMDTTNVENDSYREEIVEINDASGSTYRANDHTKCDSESADLSNSNPSTSVNEGQVVAELAVMNPMDYDRVRIEKAKEMGVQVRTLDDQVKQARIKKAASDNLPFDTIDPWSESVDCAQLLDGISQLIRRHIVLDLEQADAAALWVIHTYLIDCFEFSPIAIVNAPEKGCAKSLFQTILIKLVYRPLYAANATASALFRSVELWKPTIFFDEADTFFRENNDLHGMINAGCSRDGSVMRCVSTGDNFVPQNFSVFSAKSISGITLEKCLQDSTMSRGIIFNMHRKRSDEKVERLRNADTAAFDVIKSKLARFALDYAEHLRQARPQLPDELSDRDQDKWEPLLAIAECAGDEWLKRATEAALKLSHTGDAPLCKGAELLSDIRHIFDSGAHPEKISTADLIEALCKNDEAPWPCYNFGKPITPRQLAKLLVPYGIKSRTVRVDRYSTPKGYYAADFEDAFSRYIPSKK